MAGLAAAVPAGEDLTAAVAVGYGQDELVRPAIMALEEIMAQAGIVLGECLHVDGDRYWSCTRIDQARCPEAGVPSDAAGHAAPAAVAAAGEHVLDSRAAMSATVVPVTGEAADSMRKVGD